MIKKPDLNLPHKPFLKEALKKGVDFIAKLADQDDEQLAKIHTSQIAAIISQHLLKVVVSDEPVDREIKQAVKYIIDAEANTKPIQNEWVEVLKEALLRIEVQYSTDENNYVADVFILYLDENIAGDKKPKAVKVRSTFSYDELPQDLRHDIFEANNQQQILSIELFVKEQ